MKICEAYLYMKIFEIIIVWIWMSMGMIKQSSIIYASTLQHSEILKVRKCREFQNHIKFAPKFNFPVVLEPLIKIISILSILLKFNIKFEMLAISLFLISRRALKAQIIDKWFISAIFIFMMLISKIFVYKYASLIFSLEFYPFVTKISFRGEKMTQ